MFERICFYTRPFPRVKSYRDIIDMAAERGMETVEGYTQYELYETDLKSAREIKAYADSKNVKFSCLSTFADLAGADREEQIEKMKRYADVAAAIGSPYFHHTALPGRPEGINNPALREELFKIGIASVREVYDYAQTVGVRTVLEDQGYYFNGVEGFGRLLKEVERDIGVVADFGNIYHVEEHITDFIELTKDRICQVHLKDVKILPEQKAGGLLTSKGNFMHEAFFGEGDVKFKEGMKMLRDIGYKGYYALEYGGKTDDTPLIDKALELIAAEI